MRRWRFGANLTMYQWMDEILIDDFRVDGPTHRVISPLPHLLCSLLTTTCRRTPTEILCLVWNLVWILIGAIFIRALMYLHICGTILVHRG